MAPQLELQRGQLKAPKKPAVTEPEIDLLDSRQMLKRFETILRGAQSETLKVRTSQGEVITVSKFANGFGIRVDPSRKMQYDNSYHTLHFSFDKKGVFTSCVDSPRLGYNNEEYKENAVSAELAKIKFHGHVSHYLKSSSKHEIGQNEYKTLDHLLQKSTKVSWVDGVTTIKLSRDKSGNINFNREYVTSGVMRLGEAFTISPAGKITSSKDYLNKPLPGCALGILQTVNLISEADLFISQKIKMGVVTRTPAPPVKEVLSPAVIAAQKAYQKIFGTK